jgi:MFS family permease
MSSPEVHESGSGEVTPPTGEGFSVFYGDRKKLRRYIFWFALASAAVQLVLVSGNAILLPNHVQMVEMGNWFFGADASVNLQALTQLNLAVQSGTATATPEQARLLGILASFEAARATGLAIVVALSTIATMIVQPLIGVFSDRTRSRLGRRAPWILYGAIAGGVGLIGLGFSPSIALIAFFWTLVLAGLNGTTTAMLATVADRVPEERRGSVSSLTGFGSILGGIIGSIIAGLVFSMLGLSLWFIWAFFAVAGVTLFVVMNRDRSSRELVLDPFRWGPFLRGFAAPFRARDFRWVWVSRLLLFFGYTAANALGFFALQSYIQPNLSAAEATALTPLIAIAGVPFTIIAVLVSGRISDKMGRRKPFIIASALLMAVSMLILVIWPTVPALFIQVIVASFGFGVFLPVDQAFFIDVLPDQEAAGRDLGIANVASLLGTALAPVLAAQVVSITGGYQWTWIVAAVLVALAAVTILPVRRP